MAMSNVMLFEQAREKCVEKVPK